MIKMKKITSYFKPIEKRKVYHCLKDCFYDTINEEVGPMVACDGCDLRFHNYCIDSRKALSGPSDGDGAWFCPDCKSIFINYHDMKQEIKQLRRQLLQLSRRSSGTIAGKRCTNDNHGGPREPNNRPPRATKEGEDNDQTYDPRCDPQNEIKCLKEENLSLQSRLEQTPQFVNQVLESKVQQKNLKTLNCVDEVNQNQNQIGKSNNGKNGNRNKHKSRDPIQVRDRQPNNIGIEKLSTDSSTTKQHLKPVLILGDSHIQWLDSSKLKNTVVSGISGLTSNKFTKEQ